MTMLNRLANQRFPTTAMTTGAAAADRLRIALQRQGADPG